MVEVKIGKAENGMKAERFLRKYLNYAPLSFIYASFRKKDVKVNGHWIDKNHILKEGDILRVYVKDEQLEDFKKPRKAIKRDMPYRIVYEDENILIMDKPKGLLVYGDDKGSRETLGNAVLDYLYFKGEYDPENSPFTPSPAHRLDRNTSGLIIYGKNREALDALVTLFRERTRIEKGYTALVVGDIDKPGEVNVPLLKKPEEGRVYPSSIEDGGKPARTVYRPIERFGDYTLVTIGLLTGRTHQIRVHMAYINHPIVGDNKYGNFEDDRKWEKYGLKSQFLHASELIFLEQDGILKGLSGQRFLSDLPDEYKKFLKLLKDGKIR